MSKCSSVLNFDNFIQLDAELVSAVINIMNERKKYLAMHTETTYPDRSKGLLCTKLGGKVVSAKTQEKLDLKIISYYKAQELTFFAVMQREIERKLATKSIIKATSDRYYLDYERYVKNSLLEKKTVSQVNSIDIKKFLEEMLTRGISKKNFSNLCSLLNIVYFYSDENTIDIFAIKKKMQISTKQYDKSNRRSTTDSVFSTEEEQAIIKYCEKEANDLRALGILYMLKTGIAISELVALQLRDTDITAREYRINRIERKFKNAEGKTVYEITEDDTAKTETRLKTAYLNDEALEIYKKILSLSEAKAPTDFIFEGRRSYTFSDFLRRNVLEDLGIEKRGLHSLRKTYATNLIDANISLSTVQTQMRHADIETTMKYYYKRKKSKEELIEEVNRVSNREAS